MPTSPSPHFRGPRPQVGETTPLFENGMVFLIKKKNGILHFSEETQKTNRIKKAIINANNAIAY